MDDKERKLIKTLNKIGVDTRFISLYENVIYVNNLKFSRFSRKKEEDFHQTYPDIKVIRSKLFQKICIKVSRTIKNQIKPRDIIYIKEDDTNRSHLLNIVLEPYRRKYGITLTKNVDEADKTASTKCMNDFAHDYIKLMINSNKITNDFKEDVIYPLLHVDDVWINDWIETTTLDTKKYENKKSIENEIIDFLDTKIPNVCESLIQSVNYLDKVEE